MEKQDCLIVGLGNPGTKYERTRHNLGFMVVDALASKWALAFKRGWKIDGKIASGEVEGVKVHLLKPATYMNLSGAAVVKAAHYYKIDPGHIFVIVDDVYVKFGAMRMRMEGGTGGHNGLKSVQASLGTQNYPRLRMGVGPLDETELPNGREILLEEYVLANFTPKEQQELPRFVEEGASVVEVWLKQGPESAIKCAGELINRKVEDARNKTTL